MIENQTERQNEVHAEKQDFRATTSVKTPQRNVERADTNRDSILSSERK